MQHLTRWRTVTAAATTAALAAGAFGIANAVSGNVEQPSAIELAADANSDDLQVVDDATASPNSVDSQVSPTTTSADDPSAIVPPTPASVDSAAEASRAAGDQTTRVPVPDSPASPDSTSSANSPQSPASTLSPSSAPSPASANSPDSAPSPASANSPDSPESVDSPSSADSAS